MLKIATLALALTTLAALTSCQNNKNLQPAQAPGTAGRGGFEEADTNHDGFLSRDEASDFLVSEVFNSRDTNHDGRMTQEEWAAGDAKRRAQFKARDKDHDGVISKDEAIAYGRKHSLAAKMMASADKNGDGKLSKKEVEAYYASREGTPR